MEKIECNTPEEIYAYFKQRADVYKTEIHDMEAGIYDWIGKKERLAGLKEEYEFATKVAKLLGKQIMLKPTQTITDSDLEDFVEIMTYCGTCGVYLGRYVNVFDFKHCPECGQKFDWSH